MKVIKIGTPFRKHKCSKCKSVYIYHTHFDKDRISDLIYCPICKNYLDFHFYDKKISEEQYKKLCKENL